MAKVLRIAKWRKTFEKADSRKYDHLHWVSVPTNSKTSGMMDMVDHFGDRAPIIHSHWLMLVTRAANASHRGVLASGKGKPWTLAQLAEGPWKSEIFAELISWAKDKDVGWLEEMEFVDAIADPKRESTPPKGAGQPVQSDIQNAIQNGTPDAMPGTTSNGDESVTTSVSRNGGTNKQTNNQTNPPNPPTKRNRTLRETEDWEGGEDFLLGMGIRTAASVLASCRERSCSWDDVKAVIAFWQSNHPKWGLGALVDRLKILKPTQTPDSLWPVDIAETEADQARAKSLQAARNALEAREAAKSQREAERRARAEIEAQFGDTLDSLPLVQQQKLLREFNAPELAPRVSLPPRGLVREVLGDILAKMRTGELEPPAP